jgi:dynein intermediate chain
LSETGEEGNNPNHFGMVTAVATRVLPRNDTTIRAMSRGFLRGSSGLVLSTGVDWTTKLWAPAYTDQPLLSFLSHSYDYMCDVQWCVYNNI